MDVGQQLAVLNFSYECAAPPYPKIEIPTRLSEVNKVCPSLHTHTRTHTHTHSLSLSLTHTHIALLPLMRTGSKPSCAHMRSTDPLTHSC